MSPTPLPPLDTKADWLAAVDAVATAVAGQTYISNLPFDGVGDLLVRGFDHSEPDVVAACVRLAVRLLNECSSSLVEAIRGRDIVSTAVTWLDSPDVERRIQIIMFVRLISAKFDSVSTDTQQAALGFFEQKLNLITEAQGADAIDMAAQLIVRSINSPVEPLAVAALRVFGYNSLENNPAILNHLVSAGLVDALDRPEVVLANLRSHDFIYSWTTSFCNLFLKLAQLSPLFFSTRIVATLVDGLAGDNEELCKLTVQSVLKAFVYSWRIPKDFDSKLLLELVDIGFVRNIFAMIRRGIVRDVETTMTTIKTLLEMLDEVESPNRIVVEIEQCDGVVVLRGLLDENNVTPDLKNTISRLLRTYFPHHSTAADTSIIPFADNKDIAFKIGYSSILEVTPRTLVEMPFVVLMTAILSKPSWWTKIGDAAIADKWRAEAAVQGVSAAAINLALEETAFLATHGVRSALGGTMTVVHGAVERTVVSDDAVAGDLRAALVALAGALENVPEHKKDWHPGTGNQVLDLVHPSLFCLVYGRTLVADIGERRGATEMLPWDVLGKTEKVADVPVFDSQPQFSSRRFQWLPAEFRVQDDGSVSILSPINNLHPMRHRGLYVTIAKVFSRFVPLFEELAGIMDTEFSRSYIKDPAEGYQRPKQYDDEGNEITDIPRPVHVPKLPEHFEPPEKLPQPLDWSDRNLQVIVKLANIHLTPEKPKYGGGSWHIEGTANESIVATGICYYDMDNITTSRPSFRAALNEDIRYEQDDRMYWMDVYGIENQETERNEELGALEAKLGRCIVFPNVYQHRVEPFELADPTLPGFRKILVFFLVDPTKRVVSTAHLVPQQQGWHEAGLRATPLPPELWPLVTQHIPGTMTLDNAKELRLELMKERTDVQGVVNYEVFGQRFTLCEH
ncbi:hypothetical protein HK105_205081 [Polyrhizophydium stewartii]|uniref:Uncharacterized protein n=1 Tax=Polyrhizophydium stewartii TaxID=2732419 RepID=A0ABR4N7I7_9FUNG